MRKTFVPLDDALIERLFQPASDVIVHHLGRSRTAVACCCIDVASLAWIVSRGPALAKPVGAWDAGGAVIELALLLLGLTALVSLRILFQRVRCAQANPLRQGMRPHRAVVLLMLLSRLMQMAAPGLAELADLTMLSCAVVALYLGACAERPPVRRSMVSLAAASAISP